MLSTSQAEELLWYAHVYRIQLHIELLCFIANTQLLQ